MLPQLLSLGKMDNAETMMNRPNADIDPHRAPSASKRIGIAAGEKLGPDEWDSDETNADIAALFGA